MKLRIFMVIATLFGLAQAAWAQSNEIQESDFPCALVLCFANPQGAWAEPACHPPMNWLMNLLRNRRGFPQCRFAEGGGATFQSEPNVDCAPGFTAEQSSDEYTGVQYSGMCVRRVPSCNEAVDPKLGASCLGNAGDSETPVSYFYRYAAPKGVTLFSTTVQNKNGNVMKYFFNLR